MKLGIMQPYFLPYIGYWQLMNAVDQYVIYDDVNYIKKGWVNRNRILMEGKSYLLTIPVVNASQNKKINELKVDHGDARMEKALKTIAHAYRRAPFFLVVFPLAEEIFLNKKNILSEFLVDSITTVCRYIGIHTRLLLSSRIDKNNELRGQEKILEICRRLGAQEYYNAIGGRELYSVRKFEENGIGLWFVQMDEICYPQFSQPFEPGLSILDVMMFNPPERIRDMLGKYELVGGEDRSWSEKGEVCICRNRI